MNESKITPVNAEFANVIDSAYALFDEPRATAFFALLDPYQGRMHTLPLATLAALRATGADLGLLGRICDALVGMSDAGGPAPNRESHFDMLELQYVLRSIARLGALQ